MKRTLWMLGVAVAALTSCTQSEVLDVSETKKSQNITFEPFVGKHTRAIDDVLESNFDVFYVFADKGTKTGNSFTADSDGADFFDTTGTKVYRTSSTITNDAGVSTTSWNNWLYSPVKPWTMNKTYRFAGYANGYGKENTSVQLGNEVIKYESNMSNVTTLTGETLTNTWGFDFTNIEANVTDMIVAVPDEECRTSTAEAVSPMNLTFSHMFAKIIFRFVLDQNSNQDLTVNVHPFNLNAIKTSDCKVYNNSLLVSSDNKTEINWASQSIKASNVLNEKFKDDQGNEVELATGQILTNTNHITLGNYVIVKDEGSGNSSFNLTRDKPETNVVENDQSIIFYVIPQSNDVKVTFTATSRDGSSNVVGTTTFSDVSLKITGHDEWKPGFVYRYTASLNPQVNNIHFSASVTDWSDTSGRDQGIVGTTTSTTQGGGN